MRGPGAFVFPAVIGLVLRAALIAASPEGGMQGGDLPVYHGMARALVEDRAAWFGIGEFGYRPPLFFVYLAAVYALAPAPAPYWLGQLATAALLLPLLASYARLADALGMGARATAWLLWLRALLPTFVVTDVQILSEPLFEVLLLAIFALAAAAVRHGLTPARAIALGMAAGALVLTREVGAAFLAGLAIAAGLEALRKGVAPPVARLALLCVACALPLAPWLVRNQIVHGSALPISMTSGVILHIGHHPDATGTWGPILAPAHQPPAELAFATPAWSRWHGERALAYIVEDPWRAVARARWKLAYLVFPRAERQEIIADRNLPGLPSSLLWVLVVAAGGSSALLVATLPLGFAALPPSFYRRAALVGVFAYLACVATTFGAPRYLDPVVHLGLPGIAMVLGAPRPTMQRALGRTGACAGVSVASAAIVLLWAMILLEKDVL